MIRIWKKISKLGITSSMSIAEMKKVELSNQFSFIVMLLLVGISIVIASFGLSSLFSFYNLIFLAPAITFLLNWKGFTNISGVFLSLLIPLVIIFLAVSNKLALAGEIPYTAYLSPRFGLIGVSIAPMILIDHRHKKTLLGAVLFQLLCLFMLDDIHEWLGIAFASRDGISVEDYDRMKMVMTVPYVFITSATYFLISITERYEVQISELVSSLTSKNTALNDHKEEITQQNQNLQQAYSTIDTKNHKLTDSIRYARRIQNALLPKQQILASDFSDYFVLNKPKDIVSGDFFWIKKQGQRTYIAVADCTGHGVPGAMMSMLGISALNDIISMLHAPSPAEVLEKLRDRIKDELDQTSNSSNTKDGMDMAMCVFDSETKQMEFAGANNPAYLVSSQELSVIKPTRNPISFFVKEKEFENKKLELNTGDWLYLFSDGYADQFGGETGFKYTLKQFKQIILQNATQKGETQKANLEAELKTWKNGREQVDDILVLGLRVGDNFIC